MKAICCKCKHCYDVHAGDSLFVRLFCEPWPDHLRYRCLARYDCSPVTGIRGHGEFCAIANRNGQCVNFEPKEAKE